MRVSPHVSTFYNTGVSKKRGLLNRVALMQIMMFWLKGTPVGGRDHILRMKGWVCRVLRAFRVHRACRIPGVDMV